MILAKLSQLQGFGEKFIAKMGEVSERVRTLEAVGAQANLIERILVNGDPLSIGANKTVNIPVPTRVNQLENDASYQENVIERIQVNGATQGITNKTVNLHMPTAVSELTNDENYQTNVLEGVKVNGAALTVDAEKNVNVSVPTKVSQLSNDKTYQTKSEVESTVKTAVAGSKHTSFQKVSSVPAAADAKEDVMYLVMNSVTKHYDIYAKIADDAGNFKMELLDDTTVDLSGYVQKEAGKGLSHNDFTDALLAKLNGIAEKANLYVHPSHTAYAEGLYKVTVNALGHVTKATAVTKADITGLGIPGQDTHDWASITGKPTSYPPSGHTHDDRYYTESEMNTKLGSKVDNSQDGASDLIGKLESGSAAPTDDDLMITQWANHKNDPGHDNIYVRRPMSSLWSYIKGKADSVYQPKGSYAASSHTHTKNQITDFPTSLPASDVKAWAKADTKPSYAWSEITGKPSTFAPSSHNHDSSYYKKSEIDEKLKGTSATGHTHAWADITNKPTTFTPASHKHVKADITDFPTSMPASDVAAWAKAANKPSYTKAEVGLGSVDNTGDSAKNVSSAGRIRNDSRQTALSGTASPTSGLTVYQVYDNGYPASYGNVISVMGVGAGQILAAWSGTSGAVERLYYRNKRGTSDANWSAWKTLAFTDDKPATAGTADTAKAVAWDNVTGKPSTFTPAAHSHSWDSITGKPSTFAPSSHKHVKADITDFPTSMPANGGTSAACSGNAATATKATGVADYGDTSKTIQIGYAGAGATTSNLAFIAGYLSGGTQIKNVSKDVLRSWLGLGSAAYSATSAFAAASHTHNYAGSSSAGGTASSVNGFTFGVQTSDPGANSSLTTNKFLFVYE